MGRSWVIGGAVLVACNPQSGGLGDGAFSSGMGQTEGTTSASTMSATGTADGAATGTASGGTTVATGGDPTADGTTIASTTEETAESSDTEPADACHPLIAEVLGGIVGSDDDHEWIKLYNPCSRDIDLPAYALGWGRNGVAGTLELAGTIDAGGCVIVGGTASDVTNYMPMISQSIDLEPNLEREGTGVLLYLGDANSVTIDTLPVDALIYGLNNNAGFMDPEGSTPRPMVDELSEGFSMHRTSLDRTFEGRIPATPGDCPGF